jgi:hypothetical protein
VEIIAVFIIVRSHSNLCVDIVKYVRGQFVNVLLIILYICIICVRNDCKLYLVSYLFLVIYTCAGLKRRGMPAKMCICAHVACAHVAIRRKMSILTCHIFRTSVLCKCIHMISFEMKLKHI